MNLQLQMRIIVTVRSQGGSKSPWWSGLIIESQSSREGKALSGWCSESPSCFPQGDGCSSQTLVAATKRPPSGVFCTSPERLLPLSLSTADGSSLSFKSDAVQIPAPPAAGPDSDLYLCSANRVYAFMKNLLRPRDSRRLFTWEMSMNTHSDRRS